METASAAVGEMVTATASVIPHESISKLEFSIVRLLKQTFKILSKQPFQSSSTELYDHVGILRQSFERKVKWTLLLSLLV
jgi:hypothetical protein